MKTRQAAEHATTSRHVSLASNPAFLLGWASVLSRVPLLRTPPPCRGAVRRCHVLRSSQPHLPTWEGSSAAICPAALDLISIHGRAPALPRVPQLRTPPPYIGGLRRCHASRGTGPHLPASEGSGATARPMVVELAPHGREFWRHHVSVVLYGSYDAEKKERHTHLFLRRARVVPRPAHMVPWHVRQSH
jgi:hypothetical protein